MRYVRSRALWAAAVAMGMAVCFAGSADAAGGPSIVVKNGQLVVTGTDSGEQIGLQVVPADPSVVRVNIGAAVRMVRLSDFARIWVDGLAGDDIIGIDFGAQPQPPTIVDAGNGDDQVLGGRRAELLRGGDGDDRIDGNGGNDTVDLGNGSDLSERRPGDGADVVEGGDGDDLQFLIGSDAAERFAASATGGRLRLTHNLNQALDADSIEHVVLDVLRGADSTSIGNLAGTGVQLFDIDLGAQPDEETAPDGALDSVRVVGTPSDDAITISGAPFTAVDVEGLPTRYAVLTSDPSDHLILDTLGGADTVDTTHLTPGLIELTIH